jgi:ADP-ribose pyrophosphatase YjhB (NUDIX family)
MPILRFCSSCGGSMSGEWQGSAMSCADCGETMYRNPAVGVAVLVVQDGRVLLGRRARGAYSGKWCVPCGYVEWGEDIREAARRELWEETGLDAEIGEVVAVHSNFHDPEKLTVGVWFRGVVRGGTLRAGDDLDAVGYYSRAELPPLAFPTDVLVLRDLI